MNKDLLQQEILKRVKLGMKPSDLRKQKNNQIPTPPLSPIMVPVDKKQAIIRPKSPAKNLDKSKLKQLQNQVNFHAQTANNYLTNLQATMAKLDQAELTIQNLQAKNEKLNKILTSQIKPSKSTEETNTFICSSCSRIYNIELIRLAKKSGKKTCRNCTLLMLKRANQLTGKHIVLKIKQKPKANQPTKTFTCQTCLQIHEGEPHQVHITNFQEQGINPRQLTSICSTCLNERVSLADFYCPRTSEGRDTYDFKQPQFDCDCPIKGDKHG